MNASLAVAASAYRTLAASFVLGHNAFFYNLFKIFLYIHFFIIYVCIDASVHSCFYPMAESVVKVGKGAGWHIWNEGQGGFLVSGVPYLCRDQRRGGV